MRQHRMRAGVLLLALLTVGCAVSKKTCADCTPETLWRLNIASELKYQNDAYRTFFKDVGEAQRAGQLNNGNTEALFVMGHQWQDAIQEANRSFKALDVNPDATGKQKVRDLLLAAEKLFLELTTRRTAMMTDPGGNQ